MTKRIMTVDDAATMRKLVVMTLQSAGHQIMEASDGAEALGILQRQPFDLVITDINMPQMDGIELTRRLRALPAYQKTPIILLTTESDPQKKDLGRSAGATGWIKKPFERNQLLSIVSKILPN